MDKVIWIYALLIIFVPENLPQIYVGLVIKLLKSTFA